MKNFVSNDAVVNVPQPGGDEVGDDDVDAVVALGRHQHGHPAHRHQPQHPVQYPQFTWSI